MVTGVDSSSSYCEDGTVHLYFTIRFQIDDRDWPVGESRDVATIADPRYRPSVQKSMPGGASYVSDGTGTVTVKPDGTVSVLRTGGEYRIVTDMTVDCTYTI